MLEVDVDGALAQLAPARRIWLVGTGTSQHAAELGGWLLRGSGRERHAVSSATFDSVDTMERNRDQATALKIASMREAGVEELDECEFELALAHLRVPELA